MSAPDRLSTLAPSVCIKFRFTIGHDKSRRRLNINRIEHRTLGRLISGRGSEIRPRRHILRAVSGLSTKQAPANSVLNQRQGLFCLTRFCLSYLRTNFRGSRLVYRRCDAQFNLRQGYGGFRELAISISDNFSQRMLCQIPSVAQPASDAPLRLLHIAWARASISRALFSMPLKISAA